MLNEPVHITLNERPCSRTSSCIDREERKHVGIDKIDSIKDILSPSTLLVSICEFANCNRDADARELRFQGPDLRCEFRMWQYIVEQRLGAKLNTSSDELGLGVASQRRNERVT